MLEGDAHGGIDADLVAFVDLGLGEGGSAQDEAPLEVLGVAPDAESAVFEDLGDLEDGPSGVGRHDSDDGVGFVEGDAGSGDEFFLWDLGIGEGDVLGLAQCDEDAVLFEALEEDSDAVGGRGELLVGLFVLGEEGGALVLGLFLVGEFFSEGRQIVLKLGVFLGGLLGDSVEEFMDGRVGVHYLHDTSGRRKSSDQPDRMRARSSAVLASMSERSPRASTLRRITGSVLEPRRLKRQVGYSTLRPSRRSICPSA